MVTSVIIIISVVGKTEAGSVGAQTVGIIGWAVTVICPGELINSPPTFITQFLRIT